MASIGLDTILILENGVSQIDLPCSGVKSLWTGLLFLLAATWLERRPLNLRWLLTGLVLTDGSGYELGDLGLDPQLGFYSG